MKKTLVALAILGSFAGVASAATNVTLYGTVDAGYEKWTGGKITQGGTAEPYSKFGIKGQEDLGNGVAAIFTLEGNLAADVGAVDSPAFFGREATVGLKGAFGEVKVGRAKSQMELALGGVVPGSRVADVNLYSTVAARHSNGLFYSYDNAGFSFGADVTTKGGALGNTESSTGFAAHGFRLGYAADLGGVGLTTRVAYQKDDADTKELGGLVAATFDPVTVGVAYTQADVSGAKTKWLSAVVASNLGANDSVYAKFQNRKDTSTTKVYAVGYSHSLSKRTSAYADVARVKPADADAVMGYSVGMAHSF